MVHKGAVNGTLYSQEINFTYDNAEDFIEKGIKITYQDVLDRKDVYKTGDEWTTAIDNIHQEYKESRPGNSKAFDNDVQTVSVNKNQAKVVAKSGPQSFDEIVANPKEIWGKSADQVGEILGKGWTKAPLNDGQGWKFTNGKDGFVSFSEGSSRHGSVPYYKINSGSSGKIKVVGDGYKATNGEKSIIINVLIK